MSLEKMAWQEVRAVLVDLLRADNPALRDNTALRKKVLVPMVSKLLDTRHQGYISEEIQWL